MRTGDFALIRFCRLINVRFGDGPRRQSMIHAIRLSRLTFVRAVTRFERSFLHDAQIGLQKLSIEITGVAE